jgi:hypothetical protein
MEKVLPFVHLSITSAAHLLLQLVVLCGVTCFGTCFVTDEEGATLLASNANTSPVDENTWL